MRLALCALLLAGAAARSAAATAENAALRCPVPDGWRARGAEDGVRLMGPEDAGVGAQILARWIAPGDAAFPTMDSFVARQLELPLFKITPRTEDLGAARVAGRAARRLGRDDREKSAAPDGTPAWVPVREETLVVPGDKGFYVVSFRAAKTAFARRRRDFEAVLRGFRPLR